MTPLKGKLKIDDIIKIFKISRSTLYRWVDGEYKIVCLLKESL